MSELMTVIVGGVVGIVGGFAGALIKSYVDQKTKMDEGLIAKRTELYEDLWMLTGFLPLYPRNEHLTYLGMQKCSERLRDWYFKKAGGMFASSDSRDLYLALQKSISGVLEQRKSRLADNVEDADYDSVQKKCSALRTSITTDLQTRRGLARV